MGGDYSIPYSCGYSKGYGTYNDATKSADNTYGKEFEAVLMQTAQTISPALETATGVSKGVFSGTFTPKKEVAKQEYGDNGGSNEEEVRNIEKLKEYSKKQ